MTLIGKQYYCWVGTRKEENERLFYEWLISEADRRFDEHLRQLEH